MFWTDWDRYGPKIESANLDGTDRMGYHFMIKPQWNNPCVANSKSIMIA